MVSEVHISIILDGGDDEDERDFAPEELAELDELFPVDSITGMRMMIGGEEPLPQESKK